MSPRRSPVVVLASASALFAVMALVAKRACTRLPGTEVAFVRFAVGIVATALAATRVRLRPRNWRGLFWRGAFGGAAVLGYFTAIQHLAVGLATLLNYTSPVFTALWAALFLGERIGRRAVAALGVTTVGVLLVIHGGAPPGALGFDRWTLVGIAASVLSGAAVATIREVRRTDGSWEIFAAFCVIGALVTGVPAAGVWVRASALEWAMMVLVGVLAVAAQVLMTWSLRYLQAGVAGILMQLTPVLAIAFGWLLFGERTAGLSLAGAGVTFAGVSWGAWLAAAPAVED